MKEYIGNVVTQNNLRLEKGLFKCSTIKEAKPLIPTMVIGIEQARTMIPNFSILKKKYNHDRLWWTFSKSERLFDYKNDMEQFYHHCVTNVDNNVKYELVDVKKLKYGRIKRLLKYMRSCDKKYIYNDSDKFLFIYSPTYRRIWGISLSTSNYMGISTSSILKRVLSNAWNEVINDFTIIPYSLRSVTSDKIHKLMVLYEYFIC